MSVKVHRIELYNFKSYHGNVSVGPFHDFTCIVGPNGSGKSNIMDALSFVLGSSAASLRGTDVSEFINRKAKKKECSVTLVLRQSSGNETKLTRSIDAKGNVTVSVDKIAVNEKEFTSVLKKYRLGSRIGSFLVFQHEVDSVAQKKAKEITELFEQISGSIELKDEYNQKRKALDVANEQLTAASMEKRGAIAEVNQMRLHKKEAERFSEINDQFQKIRRDLALTELFFIESSLTKGKQDLVRFQLEVQALQKEIASEEDIRELKKTYADKHKTYMEHLKNNRSVNIDLRDKKSNLDRLEVSLQHLQKKLVQQKEDQATVAAATTVRSKETQRLEEQLKQQEALMKAFEEQCAKEDAQATSQGSLTATQMQEYRRLKKESDCESISLRQELDSITRQRESIAEGMKQAVASLENTESARKELIQTIARNKERLVDLHRKAEDLLASQKDLKDKEHSLATSIAQAQARSKEHEAELAKIQQQLHELRFVKEDNKHATKMNDALQSLRSLHSGIRGRLVDLCEIPNPKYRNAVTVAFGKNLEAVVVDTTETAVACVKYLKEQRLTTMTFLPLNALKGKGADDSLRTFGGTAKPIADVIKFDVALEPAIRYSLGQAIVCDTVEEAKRIAYGQSDGQRYKVVTVDGTVLLKNGAIQGGLAAIQSRAKKWDEKRYDDLKAARDKVVQEIGAASEGEIAKAQCELKDLQSRSEFAGKRIEAIRLEAKAVEGKIHSLEGEMTKGQGTIADLEKRVASYKQSIAKCDGDIEQHRASIQVIEQRIFADFQKKVNIPNISELEVREMKQAKVRAERRQQLQLVIQKLRSSIESESKRIGVRSLSDVDQAITKTVKEIETCKKDFEVYGGITKKLERRQDDLQQNITRAKAELDNLEDEIRRSSKSSEEEVRKLAHVRKQSTSAQAACEALRLQRLSLFQRCKMEETELPTVDPETAGAKRSRTTDTVPAPKKKGAAPAEEDLLNISEPFHTFSDTEATRKGTAKEIQVCIDFSSLPVALRQQAVDRAIFSSYKQKAESSLEQLEREMESIAPNLKATTRFGNSETKLGASSSNLDEAREKSRKALIEFTKVKDLRVQRFMSTFEKIAENVDRVYRELTLGTRAHDVHGSAYLTLEDAEEPYHGGTKYHATPPMKRFMTMELLSGGERTMAALALLFAINAVSPTPFFVLDEVDAALDIGNVVKLGNFLKSHSGQCQFIVVSLKEQLYHLADGLIGVYKDKENESSGSLTLDLRGIPN